MGVALGWGEQGGSRVTVGVEAGQEVPHQLHPERAKTRALGLRKSGHPCGFFVGGRFALSSHGPRLPVSARHSVGGSADGGERGTPLATGRRETLASADQEAAVPPPPPQR